MPNHITITIDGVTYNTIRDAWRALSPDELAEITVRKRLKAGWLPALAFLIPPLPPAARRVGHSEYLFGPE